MTKHIIILETRQLNYCPHCGDPKTFIEYGIYGDKTLHCEECDTHFPSMSIKE